MSLEEPISIAKSAETVKREATVMQAVNLVVVMLILGLVQLIKLARDTDVYLKLVLVVKHVASLGISLMIQGVYVCMCV